MDFTAQDMKQFEQIKRALQMAAANFAPSLAREVATVYPAYQVGHDYAAGDYFTHGTDHNGDPLLYSVVQAHTSAEQWPPESTPSLYTSVSLSDTGHPIWTAPSGAHDAYDTGDVVYCEKDGLLYRSKIDGNVWPPYAYPDGWEVYEEV